MLRGRCYEYSHVRVWVIGPLMLGLSGCHFIGYSDYMERHDLDGDSVNYVYDCDDTDPAIGPGIPLNLDGDGDGFGDPGTIQLDCEPSAQWVENGEDCDDNDSTIHPEADELCDDLDHNCDGEAYAGAADAASWYSDQDQDGYGAVEDPEVSCEPLADHSSVSGDCDDNAPDVHPGAFEHCDSVDEDCDLDITCGLSGTVDLITEAVRHQGDSDAAFGTALSRAGDTNGDGLGEIVAGAPGVAEVHLIGSSTQIITGPAGTGADMAATNDLNGDGRDDLAIAAASTAYIITAPFTSLDEAEAVLEASTAGLRLAAGADSTGDGTGDIAVGVAQINRTYLIDGETSGEVLLDEEAYLIFEGEGQAGAALALHDLDGDGQAELIVGAPETQKGSTFVAQVGSGTFSFEEAYRVEGAKGGDASGTAIALGDIDGDGVADLLIGAPYASQDRGTASVFFGPIIGNRQDADALIKGESGGDAAGSSVAVIPDLNRDSTDELLVGAPAAGAVYLLFGPVSGTLELGEAEAIFEGADGLGASLTYASDVDGDGEGDLAFGAPDADGAVFLWLSGAQ